MITYIKIHIYYIIQQIIENTTTYKNLKTLNDFNNFHNNHKLYNHIIFTLENYLENNDMPHLIYYHYFNKNK